MFLKMTSGDGIPDSDNRKEFALVECSSVTFERKDGGVFAHVAMPSGSVTFCLSGNVYVLNSSGKTIEAFGIAEYPKAA